MELYLVHNGGWLTTYRYEVLLNELDKSLCLTYTNQVPVCYACGRPESGMFRMVTNGDRLPLPTPHGTKGVMIDR